MENTKTVIKGYYIDIHSNVQEIKPEKNEKIHGPLSLIKSVNEKIIIYCLVDLNEKHSKNKHLYIRLFKTHEELQVPNSTFLGTIETSLATFHAFWWFTEIITPKNSID